jgi:hypothetical protein
MHFGGKLFAVTASLRLHCAASKARGVLVVYGPCMTGGRFDLDRPGRLAAARDLFFRLVLGC